MIFMVFNFVWTVKAGHCYCSKKDQGYSKNYQKRLTPTFCSAHETGEPHTHNEAEGNDKRRKREGKPCLIRFHFSRTFM